MIDLNYIYEKFANFIIYLTLQLFVTYGFIKPKH